MVFKCKYTDPGVGHHVYCRLFVAKQINTTYAQLGNGFNVMRGEEFEALRAAMSGFDFEEHRPTIA